jgi:hypothetical protein
MFHRDQRNLVIIFLLEQLLVQVLLALAVIVQEHQRVLQHVHLVFNYPLVPLVQELIPKPIAFQTQQVITFHLVLQQHVLLAITAPMARIPL